MTSIRKVERKVALLILVTMLSAIIGTLLPGITGYCHMYMLGCPTQPEPRDSE